MLQKSSFYCDPREEQFTPITHIDQLSSGIRCGQSHHLNGEGSIAATSPRLTMEQETFSQTTTLAARNNLLAVEIIPDQQARKVAAVTCQYNDASCIFSPKELHDLNCRVADARRNIGVEYQRRLKQNIVGEIDRQGQLQLFVTNATTTIVKFKLLAQLFPSEPAVQKLLSHRLDHNNVLKVKRLLHKRTFDRLAQIDASNAPEELHDWLPQLQNFWQAWSFSLQKKAGRAAAMEILALKKKVAQLQYDNGYIFDTLAQQQEQLRHLREEFYRYGAVESKGLIGLN